MHCKDQTVHFYIMKLYPQFTIQIYLYAHSSQHSKLVQLTTPKPLNGFSQIVQAILFNRSRCGSGNNLTLMSALSVCKFQKLLKLVQLLLNQAQIFRKCSLYSLYLQYQNFGRGHLDSRSMPTVQLQDFVKSYFVIF